MAEWRNARRSPPPVAHGLRKTSTDAVLGHDPGVLDDLPPSVSELGRMEIESLAELARHHARTLGPFAVRTLGARSDLGGAYFRHGLVPEGVELFELLVREHTEHWGIAHHGTVACMINLGWGYKLAGRHAALALFERAHELSSSGGAKLRLSGLTALTYIGRTLFDLGRTDEAIDALTRAHDGLSNLLGPDHPTTAAARVSLAMTHARAARPGRSVSLLQVELTHRVQHLGGEHPDTLTVGHNLGVALAEAGRRAEALDLLEDTVAARLKVLGAQHPSTLSTQHTLATLYLRSHRHEQAQLLLQAVLDNGGSTLGAEHPIMLDAAMRCT